MFLTTHLLPTTFPGSNNFTSIISLYSHKEPMRQSCISDEETEAQKGKIIQ